MLPNIENTPNSNQGPLKELNEQVQVLKEFVCLIQVTE
jgi:hypothetical protein